MTEPVDLAKPAIDAGLMTNDLERNADLLSELGLTYDHLLKIGGGVHQHRYACGNSVIKLNSHRSALAPAPSGFVRLRVGAAINTAQAATCAPSASPRVVLRSGSATRPTFRSSPTSAGTGSSSPSEHH